MRSRNARVLLGGATAAAALVGAMTVPATAGEPPENRHSLQKFECTWDGVSQNARATVRAATQIRTKDMKNNDETRIPRFYKLRAKVEFKTLRLGGLWRTVDQHTTDSVWLERHGQWIHKQYTQPSKGVRGNWWMSFGDTTLMTDVGDFVRAKITVTLDKKPGTKVWKYKRWTRQVQCGGITSVSP